jgi:small subunit ribosomal protein S3
VGQKVNPHGFRVGVIKNWDSRWFTKDKDFGDTLVEDYNLRKYLKKTLYSAGVPKVEIERDANRVRIHIHCAKPGMVIGRKGEEIEKLKVQCKKLLNTDKDVFINIAEIRMQSRYIKRQLARATIFLPPGKSAFAPMAATGIINVASLRYMGELQNTYMARTGPRHIPESRNIGGSPKASPSDAK